jgi:hypothetical protein
MGKQAVIASFFFSIILLVSVSVCSCGKSTTTNPLSWPPISTTSGIAVTSLPATGSLNVSATSIPSMGPLMIITTSLPNSFVEMAYYQVVQASGGSGKYTNWTILFGTLTNELALNPTTGVISGIPAMAGTSSFTVQVTDSNGNTATQELMFNIAPLS